MEVPGDVQFYFEPPLFISLRRRCYAAVFDRTHTTYVVFQSRGFYEILKQQWAEDPQRTTALTKTAGPQSGSGLPVISGFLGLTEKNLTSIAYWYRSDAGRH